MSESDQEEKKEETKDQAAVPLWAYLVVGAVIPLIVLGSEILQRGREISILERKLDIEIEKLGKEKEHNKKLTIETLRIIIGPKNHQIELDNLDDDQQQAVFELRDVLQSRRSPAETVADLENRALNHEFDDLKGIDPIRNTLIQVCSSSSETIPLFCGIR